MIFTNNYNSKLDARHRFYAPTKQINNNYNYNNSNTYISRYQTQPQIPSPPKQRYSKFKSRPVNLSPLASPAPTISPSGMGIPYSPSPTQLSKNHSMMLNPNLYANPNYLSSNFNNNSNVNLNFSQISNSQMRGLLKRDQFGWDGVKLTQYVTQQIGDNFIQNARMLDKFRKQAEDQRRIKKFGHVYGRQYNLAHQSKERPYLPAIVPVVHVVNPQHEPIQQYMEDQDGYQPHFRNVAVNTNNIYQKQQLQRYLNLHHKYTKLKDLYRRQKKKRDYDRRKFQAQEEARVEQEKQRQRQRNSIEKIKGIGVQLQKLVDKIQMTNQMLGMSMKRSQITDQKGSKGSQSKNTGRKTKTEQKQEQQREFEKYQQSKSIQNEFLTIDIPKNPLSQLNLGKTRQKQKSPTIVYSNRNFNKNAGDHLGRSKFIDKYLRK